MKPDESRIIVALDYDNADAARQLVEELDPALCKLKVGKELFTRAGPAFVRSLTDRGFDVFLDLKFHDIPNTTAHAVAAAADLGVWMTNVHAVGGRRMMEAAAARLQVMGSETLLIAVTVLTSMGDDDLRETGISDSAHIQVMRLASLAQDSGLHGVVCSAHEAREIATTLGNGFLRVTPGIRASAAPEDDQRRTMSPVDALGAGSSFLVVGRPITRAENPLAALLAINQEIREY